MPFMLRVRRLTKTIKVTEHVLKVKVERLVETTTAGSSCALSGERVASCLIILPPPVGVGQGFIRWGTKEAALMHERSICLPKTNKDLNAGTEGVNICE